MCWILNVHSCTSFKYKVNVLAFHSGEGSIVVLFTFNTADTACPLLVIIYYVNS